VCACAAHAIVQQSNARDCQTAIDHICAHAGWMALWRAQEVKRVMSRTREVLQPLFIYYCSAETTAKGPKGQKGAKLDLPKEVRQLHLSQHTSKTCTTPTRPSACTGADTYYL
jgi:hypothetical protein